MITLKLVALKSYAIVKWIFILNLVGCFLLKSFLFDRLPMLVICMFFLSTGIYAGYSVAYYSIKYLNREDVKDRLPLN